MGMSMSWWAGWKSGQPVEVGSFHLLWLAGLAQVSLPIEPSPWLPVILKIL